ncbi:MAG: hypothetical protein K8S98_10700 [Planctomycetes bacterium]|nr:hypothetical protein [Planctomycetota bacterium]
MTRFLLIGAALFVLIAGVVFFAMADARKDASGRPSDVAASTKTASGHANDSSALPDVRVEALQRSVDALSMQVSQLSADVQALRERSSDRTPATTASLVAPALDDAGVQARQLSDSEREQVRDVLAQEFKRQEDERATQRAKREQDAAERRADSIAKKLDLAAKDTARLSEILVAENEKRRGLFENIQDSGFDREQMRTTMTELQNWKKDELTKAFGSALADQISDLDQPRRGGFGGDFGPDGGGGRNGGNRGQRSTTQTTGGGGQD